MRVKKCTCDRKADMPDGDSVRYAIGGILLIVLGALLGLGQGVRGLLVFSLLLVAFITAMLLYYLSDSHSFKCSLRLAALALLGMGTFFF